MTYAEAKGEFDIRLYRWAQQALIEEVRNDFPNFHLLKDTPLPIFGFFGELDAVDQAEFAGAVLKKWHANAMNALGERLSERSEILWRRFECTAYKFANAARRHTNAAEHVPTVSRKRLKKAMATSFRNAFQDRCLPLDPMEGHSDLTFRMQCRGWFIRTSFDFGRWELKVDQSHNVWTGKWITHEQPEVLPFNALTPDVNYGRAIGISSGWPAPREHEMELTCIAVVEHCRIMFDLFSTLLEGLELERLTKD